MEKEALERIHESLTKLGVQEQAILKTFSDRMNASNLHLKLARQLTVTQDPREATKLLQDILTLLERFSTVGSYAVREHELIQEELRELAVEDSVFRNEIATMQQLRGSAARQKLGEALSTAITGLQQQLAQASIDKRIEYAVQTLLPLIAQERKTIHEEEVNIRRALNEQNPTERLRVQRSALSWARDLHILLVKEQQEVIEPLNVLFKTKLDVQSRMSRLLDQARTTKTKITIDDVNRDLRAFTKPEDVAEYAGTLQRLERHVAPGVLHTLGGIMQKAMQRGGVDAVTLLSSRTFFDRNIQERVLKTNKTGQPFSLIMFDIDDFKNVNTELGHDGGDVVLRTVASILRSHTEITDAVCRYGGEEMAALVETDAAGAARIAERLRDEVEQDTSKIIANGKPFTLKRRAVTVSVGVATYTGGTFAPASAALTLIKAADKALYQSKNSGKNRVTVAS